MGNPVTDTNADDRKFKLGHYPRLSRLRQGMDCVRSTAVSYVEYSLEDGEPRKVAVTPKGVLVLS